MLYHIARRHGPVIWMALHNEGDWWMDTYNHEPVRASDFMYQYTNPRVVKCHSDHRPNAFSLLYHIFWCKFKRLHISLKFIYNVTSIWLPTTMALYDDGCSGVLNCVHTQLCCTCCHVHCLRCLQNAWATSWSNENEIMNGNQGDHVTFVWSWRRCKQRLSFCRTFHPFI